MTSHSECQVDSAKSRLPRDQSNESYGKWFAKHRHPTLSLGFPDHGHALDNSEMPVPMPTAFFTLAKIFEFNARRAIFH
jgi:hypothetical protein